MRIWTVIITCQRTVFSVLHSLIVEIKTKKWKAIKNEKSSFLKRKPFIQQKFRAEMGLLVDKPKAGGFGNSNDDNIAGRFFQNVDLSSKITGIDKDILHRCAAILQAKISEFEIDAEKLEEYVVETGRKLLKKYPWYCLPSSAHKILIHDAEVIKHGLVPIGELSEIEAEAKNKDIKQF